MARKVIQTHNKIAIRSYWSTRTFIQLVSFSKIITLQRSQSNLHLAPSVERLDVNHYPLNTQLILTAFDYWIVIYAVDNWGLYNIVHWNVFMLWKLEMIFTKASQPLTIVLLHCTLVIFAVDNWGLYNIVHWNVFMLWKLEMIFTQASQLLTTVLLHCILLKKAATLSNNNQSTWQTSPPCMEFLW